MRSLFDRISKPLSDDFSSPVDRRNAELASVEGELNRLLNSRSYLSGKSHTTKTILDYGVASVVTAGESKPSRVAEVVDNVRHAIETYEPRLLGPVVGGSYLDNDPTKLMVTVAGTLRESQTPIQFRIPLALPAADA